MKKSGEWPDSSEFAVNRERTPGRRLRDTLFRWGYIAAYHLLRAGYFIFRPATFGVYVAVWHGDQVLLIRNAYRPYYTLPSGGIKRNESALDAAVRELAEEVRIQVRPDELRLISRYCVRHEFTRDTVTLFEVEFPARPAFHPDRREVAWADFRTPEAALQNDLFPVVERYLMERRKG